MRCVVRDDDFWDRIENLDIDSSVLRKQMVFGKKKQRPKQSLSPS